MLNENCGIVGVYSRQNCAPTLYEIWYYHQHRGQKASGFGIFDGKEIKNTARWGLMEDSFTEKEVKEMRGQWGIAHTSMEAPQPIIGESDFGKISLAVSGNLIEADLIRQELQKKKKVFQTSFDIEVMLHLICQGDDVLDGIYKMAERIPGAYSAVILNQEGIYAVRDPYGFKPLVLGKGEDCWVVASESCAFENNQIELVRDIAPGEILFLGKRGPIVLGNLRDVIGKVPISFCVFELVYFCQPSSIVEKVSVAQFRRELGKALAQEDDLEVDSGGEIPDTGIEFILGYLEEKGIPHLRPFQRYSFAKRRSFLETTPEEREREAKRKLIRQRALVAGKRVILGDDSRVKGTQSRDLARQLKEAGAKEVHIRFSFPSIKYACRYDKSARKSEELIAAKKTEEEILAELKVNSCKLPSVESFQKVCRKFGLKDKICLACVTGEYPLQKKAH